MRRPGVLAPLGDWRFIAALIVLMVNDAVLKETFGNWTTGKLSDIAGLVVLPVLIATGLRAAGAGPRLAVRVASGALGVWFAAMKLWPPAAEATESLFLLLTRSLPRAAGSERFLSQGCLCCQCPASLPRREPPTDPQLSPFRTSSWPPACQR